MLNNNKILAFIPARGGSKGIKNKNIINLAGRPLIAWSIDAALKSKYIDDVIVSTDSFEIAEAAKKIGALVPFMRPAELAEDTSQLIDAVIYTLGELEKAGKFYDTLVLLQPTQPLRLAEDIDNSLELFFAKGQLALASVSLVDDHPLLIRSLNSDGTLKNILNMDSTCRRQDMPDYYRVNGAVYINKVSELNLNTSFNDNKLAYIMPSDRAVDIDEPKDIIMAEYYISKG